MDWIPDPGLRTGSLTQSFGYTLCLVGGHQDTYYLCLWFLCSYPTWSLGKG